MTKPIIKWDRPCYKCRSHFCDMSCKEPEQEPEQESDDLTAAYLSGVYDGKNKYAPQRKPLTDEEIAKAWAQSKGDILMRLKPFARAIEAAHGIKGE